MDLAELVYHLTSSFPKTEVYPLTDQMRRAAGSIASNIAEGKGREPRQEFLHYLAIAQGSISELETHILPSIRLKYLPQDLAEKPLGLCDEIGRMINAMRVKLKVANP